MFKQIPGGTKTVVQGITCYIPPVGFGVHTETDEIKPVEIIKRSTKAKEQYWEAPVTMDDVGQWNDWAEEELENQETDDNYVHPELQKIRQREWQRRIYGLWVYIKGEPVYVPGIFYFFLSYWRAMDTENGLPDYRLIDLEYFYFWCSVVKDPKCYGIIEIRKRRDGKSYRAACIMYESISRSKQAHGGIQSMNRDSAQDFFLNKLVSAFKTLPSFFIPEYDTAKGDTPKEELRFFRTAKKGKDAKISEARKSAELKSSITFKDRQAKAYDGRRLKVLVLDESGKVDINVMTRHLILKYCVMDNRRRIIGKQIVTSTVEEVGVDNGFKDLWEQSDPKKREKNGQTSSGLYKFFVPASRSGNYDEYGIPDEIETLKAIQEDREAKMDDPDSLNAIIRKEPLTEKEAFMIAVDQCHFNPLAINNQIGELDRMVNVTERGDLVWKNGERDTEVEWVKNPKGKWEIAMLPDIPNQIIRRTGYFRPANDIEFICGIDTVDIDLPKDEKRASKPALFIMKRPNPLKPNLHYNNAFVCKYIPEKREKAASIFYEDVIKTLVYYGCSALYERNKSRLYYHCQARGYAQFFITLPGEKEPGIHAGKESERFMVELMQEYLRQHVEKVFYTDLLEDLLKFDISNTTKHDLTMAAGWCVVANYEKAMSRNLLETKTITDYFTVYKLEKSF